jgi:hypothetical protein
MSAPIGPLLLNVEDVDVELEPFRSSDVYNGCLNLSFEFDED